MIGVKIGKNVVIAAYVIIDPFFPELITLEDGTSGHSSIWDITV